MLFALSVLYGCGHAGQPPCDSQASREKVTPGWIVEGGALLRSGRFAAGVERGGEERTRLILQIRRGLRAVAVVPEEEGLDYLRLLVRAYDRAPEDSPMIDSAWRDLAHCEELSNLVAMSQAPQTSQLASIIRYRFGRWPEAHLVNVVQANVGLIRRHALRALMDSLVASRSWGKILSLVEKTSDSAELAVAAIRYAGVCPAFDWHRLCCSDHGDLVRFGLQCIQFCDVDMVWAPCLRAASSWDSATRAILFKAMGKQRGNRQWMSASDEAALAHLAERLSPSELHSLLGALGTGNLAFGSRAQEKIISAVLQAFDSRQDEVRQYVLFGLFACSPLSDAAVEYFRRAAVDGDFEERSLAVAGLLREDLVSLDRWTQLKDREDVLVHINALHLLASTEAVKELERVARIHLQAALDALEQISLIESDVGLRAREAHARLQPGK